MEGDEDEGEGGKDESQGLLPALDDHQVKDGPADDGQATLLPVGPHLQFTSTHLTPHCVLIKCSRKFHMEEICLKNIISNYCQRKMFPFDNLGALNLDF